MGKPRSNLTVWIAFAFVLAGCGETDIPPEPPIARLKDPEARSVAEGVNAFALDLYAELKGREGNLFFSPYSISTALAMTYAGARGATALQMANCLHFTLGQERLHPAIKRLIDDLNARAEGGGFELSVTNALWGQKGKRFIEDFTKLLENNYAAGMKQADFENEADAARPEINAWVEKETRGRIKHLIGPGVLDELTRLVLANAVYFKGAWLSAFREHNTRDRDFTLRDGGKVKARMMFRGGGFWYGQFDGLQVLELPYRGGGLSMVVLLPAEHDGLPGLEATLTERELGAWLGRLRWREVIVHLPKFRMTSDFSLARTLASMGMGDAFVLGKADLSGIDGTRELFISHVLHKAFVDVNEEGTEAAAATAVAVKRRRPSGRQRTPPVFRADRPFLFLIRDRRTGAVLFMGRVVNPKI